MIISYCITYCVSVCLCCVSANVTNSSLIGVLSKLQPSMMQPLLRRLVFDVPYLTENSKMPLKVEKQLEVFTVHMKNILIHQMKLLILLTSGQYFIYQLLTSHYEERWKYYSLTGGQGDQGSASEEELHLSRKLFWGVFNALAIKVNYFEYLCQS